MTVAELKTKIHTEFEIPTNVQRWIIGKNLAEHDGATLDELHAADGSPVFLYLVAPGNLIHSNVIPAHDQTKTSRNFLFPSLSFQKPMEIYSQRIIIYFELIVILFMPFFFNYKFWNFIELHVDNTAQANKPQPAEEIPEELPQEDPPMEALEQAVEDEQETEGTDKMISAINEQVNMHLFQQNVTFTYY